MKIRISSHFPKTKWWSSGMPEIWIVYRPWSIRFHIGQIIWYLLFTLIMLTDVFWLEVQWLSRGRYVKFDFSCVKRQNRRQVFDQATVRRSLVPCLTRIFIRYVSIRLIQVVSGCQSGTISIWDPLTGENVFQFHKPHGEFEVTALCFDDSGRRLITGSRDGYIKMWNYNNGQILRLLKKDSCTETTDILFLGIVSFKLL